MTSITMRDICGHNICATLAGRQLHGVVHFTQGVAVGLEYDGPSARRLPMERIRRLEKAI